MDRPLFGDHRQPHRPGQVVRGGPPAAASGAPRTAGASWTPLTDHLPAAAIGALAFDPANENIIYAGTGEPNFANHCLYGLGIYKSTDGGDSWKVIAGAAFRRAHFLAPNRVPH